MTDQQNYTPSEEHFRDYYIGGRSEYDPDDPGDETSREDWDEWLARVRAEAAREALDGLDPLLAEQGHHERSDGIYWARDTLAHWRDTHYPEGTP